MHSPSRLSPGHAKQPTIKQSQPEGVISSTSTYATSGPPIIPPCTPPIMPNWCIEMGWPGATAAPAPPGMETGTPATVGAVGDGPATWIVVPGWEFSGQVMSISWPATDAWNACPG